MDFNSQYANLATLQFGYLDDVLAPCPITAVDFAEHRWIRCRLVPRLAEPGSASQTFSPCQLLLERGRVSISSLLCIRMSTALSPPLLGNIVKHLMLL